MTIRWLHLSDTHFREEELWDRRATLRALIAKVGELKAKGLAPDMVFVTGDIAWSGKAKEYEQATRFFHELNKVLELDPKDRWFLVPGNHDVDRSRITRSHRAIQAGLTDEKIVEETLRDPEAMRLLSTRLEAYYAFTADFLGAARALQPDGPWRTDVSEFSGVSVGILQLNSAWIAEGGKSDEANLLVGEAQVREALDATPDAFLRIALVHHPMRNLRDFDANRVESILATKGGAAFLLRGHLHLNRTKLQSSPIGNFFEIAAGTLYSDEANWPRGFHLAEIDLDKGEARIHLFRYSGEGNGFFAADNLTYENAPKGISKIKLPSAYRIAGKPRKRVGATSAAIRLRQRKPHSGKVSEVAREYDISLSFAGEERDYVERVAQALTQRGISVFYDRYEEANLWGKDLYQYLAEIYSKRARFCLIFASANYARKTWTSHELRSAQSHAINENREYILPARFDDTQIPGILSTTGYIDLRQKTPEKLADLVQAKLHASAADNEEPEIRNQAEHDALATIRLELDTLRRAIAPRQLSALAAADVLASLRKLPSERIAVVASETDEEAQDYAESIAAVFRNAGWDVETRTATHPSTIIGVEVVAFTGPGYPESPIPGLANEIAAMLNAAGIAARVARLRELPTFRARVFISVGKKPRRYP